MKIIVWHNHGRWLATCPECNQANKIERGQRTMGCAACYPDLRAMAYEPHVIQRTGKTVLRSVPDVDAREEARAKAQEAGQVYEIQWPQDVKQIEKILSKRKSENKNWIPGETVQDLIVQNISHGVEVE